MAVGLLLYLLTYKINNSEKLQIIVIAILGTTQLVKSEYNITKFDNI